MADFRFDVAIIGTGTSAYQAAHPLARAGKRVAVIDERPYGGTCAMRGCQPKKFLVAAAEAVWAARHLEGIGVAGSPRLDWEALQRSKDAFVDAVPARTEKGFREAGMETFHGHARFVGPDVLAVGGDRIRAETIVVATGARPRPLGTPGEEHLTTSDGFLDLPAMPDRVLFVGGGYISMEFAFVARAAGAEVTVLQKAARVLTPFEPEIVDVLVEAAEDAGIRIVTGACVDRVERTGDRLVVGCEEEPDRRWEADLVVHGAGRVPNLAGLDLEVGEVEASPRGIVVDDHLRSPTNRRVYAIGDAAATPYQLATTGDLEGAIAARNILEGDRHVPDVFVLPTAVFTHPPLASVGLTEARAREAGHDVRVNRGRMRTWPSSRRIGQTHGAFVVILENGTDRILGAHLLGHGMDEAVNVLALAMRQGVTAEELRGGLWSYPTYVSDLKYMLG
jgi:glutathione reductase (NADPH)